MPFVYALINFLILAALVWLLLGKSVKKIFTSRRERICAELDEAELIERAVESGRASALPKGFVEQLPAEPEEEPAPEEGPHERADSKAQLEEAKARFERETARRREEAAGIMEDRRRDAMLEARRRAVEGLCKKVEELFRSEPKVSELRKNEPAMAESILKLIKLTPGDMCYLMHHEVLYVTLTSAFPLPQELVDRIGARANEMLEEVGGKPSYWVKVDPALIGGLRLRIGDTVYDCSVENRLYHLKRFLSGRPLPKEITSEDIVRDMFAGIEETDRGVDIYQLGRVLSVSDGICRLDGLADIMYGEEIEFECGERGMILDIEPDRIGCVVFGSYEHIETMSRVRRVGRIASVPVGAELLGRVGDPLGRAIDGKDRIKSRQKRPIEFKAPGIPDRRSVSVPLHTGLKAVDALVPIGRGQRELIIGDRQTGKSALAIDAIINQKGKNVPCIYVAIG